MNFGHSNANDHLEFDRQIFGENLIGSSYQALVHDICEKGHLFGSQLAVLGGASGVLAAYDDVFVGAFEFLQRSPNNQEKPVNKPRILFVCMACLTIASNLTKITHVACAQHARVHEMDQAVVFGEIVLDGRARQQHPPLRLQAHQRAVRLILAIFQAMPFVAQQQPHLRFGENFRVVAKRFVADDEHGRASSLALAGHELLQRPYRVVFGRIFDGVRIDSMAKPFAELVVPIFHQRARAHDDRLVDGRLAFGTLPKQRPQQCDALQGLTCKQTNVINLFVPNSIRLTNAMTLT